MIFFCCTTKYRLYWRTGTYAKFNNNKHEDLRLISFFCWCWCWCWFSSTIRWLIKQIAAAKNYRTFASLSFDKTKRTINRSINRSNDIVNPFQQNQYPCVVHWHFHFCFFLLLTLFDCLFVRLLDHIQDGDWLIFFILFCQVDFGGDGNNNNNLTISW